MKQFVGDGNMHIFCSGRIRKSSVFRDLSKTLCTSLIKNAKNTVQWQRFISLLSELLLLKTLTNRLICVAARVFLDKDLKSYLYLYRGFLA